MQIIVLLDNQPETLKRLVANKIKEVHAWAIATQDDRRNAELAELREMMVAILDSEREA